jgi:hypothetical protein
MGLAYLQSLVAHIEENCFPNGNMKSATKSSSHLCIKTETLFLETRSYYVAQAGFELMILLFKSTGAGIIDMFHNVWPETPFLPCVTSLHTNKFTYGRNKRHILALKKAGCSTHCGASH